MKISTHKITKALRAAGFATIAGSAPANTPNNQFPEVEVLGGWVINFNNHRVFGGGSYFNPAARADMKTRYERIVGALVEQGITVEPGTGSYQLFITANTPVRTANSTESRWNPAEFFAA